MLSIQNLSVGTSVKLKDGSTVRVRENPGDGVWLIVGPAVDDAAGGTETTLCHIDEIKEIA